jgi:hypothetical protein
VIGDEPGNTEEYRPSLGRELADYLLHTAASYPQAEAIHLVMGNLSSHNLQVGRGTLRRLSWELAVEPV